MKTDSASIQETLARAGTRLKMFGVCTGLLWWISASLGLCFMLFVLDNVLNLPAGLRLPLVTGAACFVCVAFARRVAVVAMKKDVVKSIAVFMEKRWNISHNMLINACEFEMKEPISGTSPFARKTIEQGREVAPRIDAPEPANRKKLRHWTVMALALFAAWVLYVAVFPRYAYSAMARYINPLADLPPAGSVSIRLTPPSDTVIVESEDLLVSVLVDPVGNRTEASIAPPTITWVEGLVLGPAKSAGKQVSMKVSQGKGSEFHYTFKGVKKDFSFRVFAEDTYTRKITVRVRPLPRITVSLFRITPPPYTGQNVLEIPGPPSSVACLEGSRLEVLIKTVPVSGELSWNSGEERVDFVLRDEVLHADTTVSRASEYDVSTRNPSSGKLLRIAGGNISLLSDQSPRVEFLTNDRNRFVLPGSELTLDLRAEDDFGIRQVAVESRITRQDSTDRVLKKWTYVGPPGPCGPIRENFRLVIDPRYFLPGKTYVLEAVAFDFGPSGKPGRSRPVVLRVRAPSEMYVSERDPLFKAFELLKQTIAEQRRANGVTANFRTYLKEITKKGTVAEHRNSMSNQQSQARKAGELAAGEFSRIPSGQAYASALESIARGEMSWVTRDIGKLEANANLAGFVAKIEEQQTRILEELVSLLGRVAAGSKDRVTVVESAGKEEGEAVDDVVAQELKSLKEETTQFIASQERIIDRSKSLLDRTPEDLTAEEEAILGELAREESEWAKFYEEKLTDFSKLPLQDFADPALADEINEVYQDVSKAAGELEQKKVEMAVPTETSAMEAAEDLVQNLEKWLPDTPDNKLWSMEEPMDQQDMPLAELPAELEDIVGELLDDESELFSDVEDISSSFIGSFDKGAGWGAGDGPISSMSAKGVTGNQLPNQQEIGGRSGEGRTGRSHGQMVESAATGKGGRETPTRLTPEPFEQGSVADSSKQDPGGVTGGGKLSGFGEEGLRGPLAPEIEQRIPRLTGQQSQIRQKAEKLALRLRKEQLPTGDLESSVVAMMKFDDALKRADGLALRQSYSRILDLLKQTRTTVRREAGLHRERTRLPKWMMDEITSGLKEPLPAGYEDIVSEYFRALADQQTGQ